jgi:hypothetical protein
LPFLRIDDVSAVARHLAASLRATPCVAAGLVDEVRMDVVPVVFGSGKR